MLEGKKLLLASANRSVGAIPVLRFYLLYNGSTEGESTYRIGSATTADHATWTTTGSPSISPTATWEQTNVVHPALVFDGTQYVCFYAGGANTVGFPWKLGRATALVPSDLSWTKYAGNPILAGSIAADAGGMDGPNVHFDPFDSPPWRMWYAGLTVPGPSAIVTVCYADSLDGITWTKRGKVIDVGAAGTFYDYSVGTGCVVKSGSTWYVFVTGARSDGHFRAAYCTCTDPADSTTYSALTQLTNYTGNVTVGGRTWQRSVPRGIIRDGSAYRCYMTLYAPTDTSTILESSISVGSPDLTSWGLPTELLLPFESWSTVSAENPFVIVGP